MLSDAERHEIDEELRHYAAPRAASIEALKIVQSHRGWVSDEALRDVAAALGMSVAELDNVATFYNLIYRRPVGKRVILLCDSVTCWILGCDRLRERIRETLGIRPGETTADGRFTLLPMACLGVCEQAPALMVGDELHTRLDEKRLDEVLATPDESS